MTESNETGKSVKTIVSVPITVAIVVPIEIGVDIPDDKKTPWNDDGDYLVDPLECPEAAEAAAEAANNSDACGRAMDRLIAAALRFKASNPDVDICFTPFAGVIEEIKL